MNYYNKTGKERLLKSRRKLFLYKLCKIITNKLHKLAIIIVILNVRIIPDDIKAKKFLIVN